MGLLCIHPKMDVNALSSLVFFLCGLYTSMCYLFVKMLMEQWEYITKLVTIYAVDYFAPSSLFLYMCVCGLVGVCVFLSSIL